MASIRSLPPLGVILGMVGVVFLGGCMGGHEFMLEAPRRMALACEQVEKGAEEYHLEAVGDIQKLEMESLKNLKRDAALYVLEAGKVIPADGGDVRVEDIVKKLEPVFSKHAERKIDIDSKKANESKRYLDMVSLIHWIRGIAGQVVDMETRRYATYEQLKEMAATYAREVVTKGDEE